MQAAFLYSSFVDVSSGFLNILIDVKMYSVHDDNREQYSNFMNIKQLRIKNQMALYWLLFLGSQTFGNLVHKLRRTQTSQEISKIFVWKSFCSLSENTRNHLWYFQNYPISSALLFNAFMTSCLTTYRYGYFMRMFLCFRPIFLHVCWYTEFKLAFSCILEIFW